LFSLCESMGGISFQQVILAFPVLLCTIISGTCLGLLLSALLEKELKMQGYVAFAAILFYVVLPSIITLPVLVLGGKVAARRCLVVASPFFAMTGISRAQDYDLIAWNCAFSVVVGLPLLPVAIYLLPRLYVRPGGLAGFLKRLRGRFAGKIVTDRPKVRPPIIGNPITWKDLHIHYGGESRTWLNGGLSCIGIGAFVVVLYALLAIIPPRSARFEFFKVLQTALFAISIFAGVNYLYGAVSRAASCCRQEKATRSLELLLTTDISGYSIIMGKSNAISLTQLPWIILFLGSSIACVVFGILSGSHTVALVIIAAAVVLNLFCMVFAYEYMAIYFSLKLKNFSTATALAVFVAWYVVGNLVLFIIAGVLIPFTVYISILVIPIGGPVIIGNHFRLRLIEEFSSLANNQAE
ncbi:hypothetical protein BVX99_00395, partial [bacterium F16]